MTLHLAPGLELPPEAVTQTFGILAKRGAGKSNTAAVLAEQMYEAKLPFVVVDPVGAWWGLRSSRNGKDAGLSIPIFGGSHADVPLEPGGGKLLADLLVNENLSAVLDVSGFETEGPKRRFLADFAERLYTAKGKQTSPLHLFLEEADDYIPQRASGDVARTLGAFERIVKRGRSRGIGATMITQRSAALNKDVLTQIETLIVLRTTSPQDRKAIEGWITYHGQSKEILASLQHLRDGEGWFWSPWLELTKRVQFPRRSTFDSGQTPKLGAKRQHATLADVDLAKVRDQMAETIERAKAEDPKELHRRIRELEKEVVSQRDYISDLTSEARSEPETVEVEVPVLTDHERKALDGVAEQLQNIREVIDRRIETGKSTIPETPVRSVVAASQEILQSQTPSNRSQKLLDSGLTKSQQRILDALAWLEELKTDSTRTRVAFLAGYKPGTGHFTNLVSSLRTLGFVDYPKDGWIALTADGAVAANYPNLPGTTTELQAAVMARLTGSQRKILQVLIDFYPTPCSRTILAERAGYEAGTGHFTNLVSSLRTLGLIDYPIKGMVVALPVLFLEGR